MSYFHVISSSKTSDCQLTADKNGFKKNCIASYTKVLYRMNPCHPV